MTTENSLIRCRKRKRHILWQSMSILSATIKSGISPADFRGKFLVEESYYETNGKKHASAHLFLFTEEQDGVLLTSYEIPEGEDKNSFTYASMEPVDYGDLKKSEKFTPALYREKDGVWEGGSTSQFTPVMKFRLWERFSEACLEVSESIEVNGRRTFGYDAPIRYKRV